MNSQLAEVLHNAHLRLESMDEFDMPAIMVTNPLLIDKPMEEAELFGGPIFQLVDRI